MTWGLAHTKHSIYVVFITMQSYILTPDRSTLVGPPDQPVLGGAASPMQEH